MIRRKRAPSLFLLMAAFLMLTASSAFLHPQTIHHATTTRQLLDMNKHLPSQKTTTRFNSVHYHNRQQQHHPIKIYLQKTPPPPTEQHPPLPHKPNHHPPSRRKKRTILTLLLTLLLSPLPRPANAVIGYIPRGAQGLTDREAPSRPREKIIPSDEYLQKLEEKGGRVKEMELKVLEADMNGGTSPSKKQKKEGEEAKQYGGLRPGAIAAVEGEEKEEGEEASLSKEERLKRFQKYQAELREREEQLPSTTTTAPPSSSTLPGTTIPSPPSQQQHKLGRVSSRTPPSKIKKKSGLVATTQFAMLASAGVVWARWQNVEERKRVKKGIEIFESQKAEFFNVTNASSSDEDLAKDLRDATKGDDDDDDDDDDEDEDEPKKKAKKKPKKPSGGGGGGDMGSPSGGGGAPKGGTPKGGVDRSEYSRASDDDIDRLKDLFKK